MEKRRVMKMDMLRAIVFFWIVVGLVDGVAEQRKASITTSDAERGVRDVGAAQFFPENFRLSKLGSVEAGGNYFHIFTTFMSDVLKWRTLVFDNYGNYLGYYETLDEPVELDKGAILFPGGSYSVATGDEEEGAIDTGTAYSINFSSNGPPDSVKFETESYRFISSPKRIRVDDPSFRFMVVANHVANAMNRGRYLRIRDDFSSQALASLSEDQVRSAFSTLRARLGKVDRLDEPWLRSTDTAIFPASFVRGTFGLELVLNEKDLITGLRILPYRTAFPDIGLHSTSLKLPFNGRWLALWGGTTRSNSKYFGNRSRDHALEFVIADRYGRTYMNRGKRNEYYFAFGRPVRAPADGKILTVVDGIGDNRPRSPNPYQIYGNMVVIQHATNEVSVIGHLMNGSIVVNPDDDVKAGQIIGRCGNSGDSTQPSIYFHLQNSSMVPGGTGYRPMFDNILLWNKGRAELCSDRPVVRGDYVEQHTSPLEE